MARRFERRRGVQRRRLWLHPRHRERPGSADEPHRRPWRGEEGAHLPERDPKQGGNIQERTFASAPARGHGAATPTPLQSFSIRILRRSTTTTTRADLLAARSRDKLWFYASTRWSDSAGHSWSVCECERGRRTRGRASRTQRSPTAMRAARTSQRPRHVAGDPAKQDQLHEDYQRQCSQASYDTSARVRDGSAGWRPGRSAPSNRQNRSRRTTRNRRTSRR
jgi:hypothetical protein